jgi:hypothetical protein
MYKKEKGEQKMRIKVIIKDNCVEAVMADEEALNAKIEIIDYNGSSGNEDLYYKELNEKDMKYIDYDLKFCDNED